MNLILCIHSHSEVGGSAKVPMSMMILNDVVKRGAHPSAFKCRLLVPSSVKSVSLWEVSGENPIEQLQEWADSGILGEPGLINELSVSDEFMSVGISHLGAIRAAERVAASSKQTAASAAASAAALFKRGWDGISPTLSNLGREYWQGAKDLTSLKDPAVSTDPQAALFPMAQWSTATSISGNSPGLSRSASGSRSGSRNALAMPASATVEGLQRLVRVTSKDHLNEDEDDGSLNFNKVQISKNHSKSNSDHEIEELI